MPYLHPRKRRGKPTNQHHQEFLAEQFFCLQVTRKKPTLGKSVSGKTINKGRLLESHLLDLGLLLVLCVFAPHLFFRLRHGVSLISAFISQAQLRSKDRRNWQSLNEM